jgi:hypothetical protein
MKLAARIARRLGVRCAGRRRWLLGRQAKCAGHAEATAAACRRCPPNRQEERKILYYRNPMGLPDTRRRRRRTPWAWITSRSTRAKGRDRAATNQLRISTDKVQKLGVSTEAVQPACARADRSRRRTHRAGRTPPVCDRAEVRGLRRTTAGERDRPVGRQGPAAVRSLQPGTGLCAARIRDRHRRVSSR